MSKKLWAACVVGGLALAASITYGELDGKERSRELHIHERTATAERVVYKINRWFRVPVYDITELVLTEKLVPNDMVGIVPDIERIVAEISQGIPFRARDRRFDPTYIYPKMFDKSDPSYEVLYPTE